MAETLEPTSIASEEAFGLLVVDGINLTGIASEEAFGTLIATLSGVVPILPTGITSEEAFGSPVVADSTGLIQTTGIASAGAFGTPTVSRGAPLATGIDRVGSLESGAASAQGAGVPPLPPQDLEPFPSMNNRDFDSPIFRRWFDKLQIRVRSQNQIHANQIQKTTLHLTDFGSKNHNDLDNIQGGGGNERYHWTLQEKLDNQVRHWITLEG